jgi:hypothetical protein
MDEDTKAPDGGDRLITIGEAAALRGVSAGAIQGWILRGWLASAGSAPSPHRRGPRMVSVYWRSAVLAVEAPGRGRVKRPDYTARLALLAESRSRA